MGFYRGMFKQLSRFSLRLKKSEKRVLERQARASRVSLNTFIRCKALDIPFETVGGIAPQKAASPEKIPVEA